MSGVREFVPPSVVFGGCVSFSEIESNVCEGNK